MTAQPAAWLPWRPDICAECATIDPCVRGAAGLWLAGYPWEPSQLQVPLQTPEAFEAHRRLHGWTPEHFWDGADERVEAAREVRRESLADD